MSVNKPKGVYCPVLTPFDKDLKPDVSRFVDHCQSLLSQGCHGLAVFGTTGEATSLSVEERITLLEALLSRDIPPSAILPGTGCSALTDSIKLTRHAFEAGCAGVLMLPPFYYKAVDETGLFQSFSAVIEDLGTDLLKVYLYHIPPVSGVPLEIPLVTRLVETYPHNVVGLKDSSGDWAYTETALKELPGFTVFSGSEVFLQRNLLNGGAGTITASANVNATAIRSLFDNWAGPDGTKQQNKITKTRKILQQFPLIPSLKTIMADNLQDESWKRVRPPLTPLNAEQAQQLLGSLKTTGYISPTTLGRP